MNDVSFVGKLNVQDEAATHSHGDFEVIAFESGGNIFCGGEEIAVNAGDAAVIPPLLPHSVKCNGGTRAVLDKALLPIKKVIVVAADDAGEWVNALNFALAHAGNAPLLSAYGNLLAALIAAYAAPNGYSPAVKAVVEDIEKSLSDPSYSLENFISALPLNYDYVRKLFKKEVGVTPHEYLTRARMERARAILFSGVTNRYSDYTVTQIAEACGYSEPLYFSRVFKKYYGVAPSRYLDSLKG